MADKFLKQNAGVLTEQEGTVFSSGVADAGKIIALDSTGKIDSTILPTGVGAETKSIVAFEALVAGDFVNIFDDTGTTKVRKADASTNGKTADGFVLSTYTAGQSATVYLEGINTQCSGLTGGSYYFLSATSAGLPTNVAPSTAGQVVQRIGKAISATEISFEPYNFIVLA